MVYITELNQIGRKGQNQVRKQEESDQTKCN